MAGAQGVAFFGLALGLVGVPWLVAGLAIPIPFVLAGLAVLGASALLLWKRTRSEGRVLHGVRRAWRAPSTTRAFLGAGLLTTAAAGTLVLVLGWYGIEAIGIGLWGGTHLALIVAAGLGAAMMALGARRLVARYGPRHLLVLLLLALCLLSLLIAALPTLDLPSALFVLLAGLVGAVLIAVSAALARIAEHDAPGTARPLLLGVPAGVVLWLVVVHGALAGGPGAAAVGVLVLFVLSLVALFLLRSVPDPVVPGPGMWARIAPWGDGSGRALARPYQSFLRAPFVILYLVSNWVLFFVMSPEPHPVEILRVPPGRLEDVLFLERLYFSLPDLTEAPLVAVTSLVTAPLVNVHIVQLVYVSLLLLVFGVVFELREGTKRTLLVFFGASALGGIVAAALHAALYPGVLDHSILADAERIAWTGGSAGAFGLMGAVAARARSPWPLLAFLVLWEVNVGGWYLRSYTPAFHLSALIVGYLFTRYALPPAAPAGSRAHRFGGEDGTPRHPPKR